MTFAGGLATEGLKPFAAIYSTFLQRAYDQVVHDVAIQRLPVRFAIDRAGLVGADGPTHAGSFDLAYLGCLPGFVIMAAADEAELMHMVATAAAIDDRPVRLPLSARRRHRRRAAGEFGVPLEIGKGRILREGSAVALLSLGTRAGRMPEGRRSARRLRAIDDGRRRALCQAARRGPRSAGSRSNHEVLVTVEEGSIGGFGSHVLHFLAESGLLDRGLKVRTMVLPDIFIDQDKPERMYEIAGPVGVRASSRRCSARSAARRSTREASRA